MITTERLLIEPLSNADADFLVNLLNQPSFIENIADKGVRDRAGACSYLRDGPLASYRQHGFGLWKVSLRESHQPIGMAGLLKRDYLPLADIGYALLPEYTGQGYAYEANRAVLEWARQHQHREVLAICNPANRASAGLLYKLGFSDDGDVVPPGETQAIKRYRIVLN